MNNFINQMSFNLSSSTLYNKQDPTLGLIDNKNTLIDDSITALAQTQIIADLELTGKHMKIVLQELSCSIYNISETPTVQITFVQKTIDYRASVEDLLDKKNLQGQTTRKDMLQIFQENTSMKLQNNMLIKQLKQLKHHTAKEKQMFEQVLKSQKKEIIAMKTSHEEALKQIIKKMDELRIELSTERHKNSQLQQAIKDRLQKTQTNVTNDNQDIRLIAEISRLKAQNEYLYSLSQLCRRDYDLLMESYKYFNSNIPSYKQKEHIKLNVKGEVQNPLGKLNHEKEDSNNISTRNSGSAKIVQLGSRLIQETGFLRDCRLQNEKLKLELKSSQPENKQESREKVKRFTEAAREQGQQKYSCRSSSAKDKDRKMTLESEDDKISRKIIQELSLKVKEYEFKTKQWIKELVYIMQQISRLREKGEKQEEMLTGFSRGDRQIISSLKRTIEEKNHQILDIRSELKSRLNTVDSVQKKSPEVQFGLKQELGDHRQKDRYGSDELEALEIRLEKGELESMVSELQTKNEKIIDQLSAKLRLSEQKIQEWSREIQMLTSQLLVLHQRCETLEQEQAISKDDAFDIPQETRKVIESLREENRRLLQQNEFLSIRFTEFQQKRAADHKKVTSIINEVAERLLLLESENNELRSQMERQKSYNND